MKIGIISCVSKKQEGTHAARDLYTSDLFKKSLEYAEKNYDQVLILSAKYGVVHLDDQISNYDLTLNNFPEAAKRQWAIDALSELRTILSDSDVIYWHAGQNYNKYIRKSLENKQEFPMQGLGIGKQLKWYKDQL